MLTTSRSLINFLNTLIERNFSCVESSFKINSHDLITPIYIKKENITLNENNKNTWKIVDVRIRMLPALLILLLQRCQKFYVSYLQRARRCWTRATEFQQNSTKYTAWPEITLFFIRLKWVGPHFHDLIRRVKCPPFPPDLSPTDYVWSILEYTTWSN